MQYFLNPVIQAGNETDLLPSTVRIVYFYYTPVLIAIGFLFNLLCLATMRTDRLARESYAPYLVWLSIANLVFLSCLAVVWTTFTGLSDLYGRDGWCLVITYMSGVASFLATWYNVALSVDRFICTFFADRQSRSILASTTPFRSNVVSICLLLLAVPAYLNVTLLHGVIHLPTEKICVVLPDFITIIQILSELDLAVNVVVASSIILVSVSATAIYICLYFRHRTDFKSGEHWLLGRWRPLRLIEDETPDAATGDQDFCHIHRPEVSERALASLTHRLQQHKQTISVLLTSSVFLLLFLPAHILQSWIMFSSLTEKSFRVSSSTQHVQQLLLIFWYTGTVTGFPIQLAFNPLVVAQISHSIRRVLIRTRSAVN